MLKAALLDERVSLDSVFPSWKLHLLRISRPIIGGPATKHPCVARCAALNPHPYQVWLGGTWVYGRCGLAVYGRGASGRCTPSRTTAIFPGRADAGGVPMISYAGGCGGGAATRAPHDARSSPISPGRGLGCSPRWWCGAAVCGRLRGLCGVGGSSAWAVSDRNVSTLSGIWWWGGRQL